MEDDNNRIEIGSNTVLNGKSHFACIEGTNIKIGNECLLSSEVTFRTGDSHSLLNLNGDRINPSLNIEIANHVWIGNKTIFTKGSSVNIDSVVATGAIVTKRFTEPHVVIGGLPATILRREISWDKERIAIRNQR